jgi:hypothetical protein
MSNMQHTILIGTGIVAALPLVPMGHFLCYGWPARKDQIISRFSDDAIALYRQTFYPRSDYANSDQFKREYNRRYGRHLFLFPVLAFVVTLLSASYLSVSWIASHDWSGTDEGTAKISIFSLAGAYVWVTYDLILRVRQNDVVTSDINRATLRLLISLPFGFAISAFAGVLSGSEVKLSTGALAFFVGAFPTDSVLKFMRRTAGTALKMDADANGDNIQQLTKIDGITGPIAERLIDEGVRTGLQLANSDPITLTIKTGMDFSFILDCCGQALVRMYFNDLQMPVVLKFGLRTGIEVTTLHDDLSSYENAVLMARANEEDDPPLTPAQAAAQNMLRELANALLLDRDTLRFILVQIAEDPYTLFAVRIWSDTD